MRLLHLKTLTLSVAIAASSSAVLAASLEGGAVAAPDRYAAEVAAQVLKRGGNAVDAAVATAFTLAITYPCLLYTSPSPRDLSTSRMPSSA